MLSRLQNDERGVALIAVMLVSMVCLSLGTVILQLSLHSSDAAAFDGKRLSAVTASESGIDEYLADVGSLTGTELCASRTGTMDTTGARYDVTVQLYDAAGGPIACSATASPATALVTSVGSDGANGREVDRRMQASVALSPNYGGFGQAIFADQSLTLGNQLMLQDDVLNDAGIYTNGDFTSTNNVTVEGPVYVQGSATISNSGTFGGGVWANGALSASNGATILSQATSSTSSVSLSNNVSVQGDARAGTSITLSGSSSVTGSQTSMSPQGAPPQQSFPQLRWDNATQAAWQAAGYTVNTYTSCATAKAFVDSGPVGSYVVRITANCALSWSNNSTVNLQGNMAIITDGSISTSQRVTFNGVGGTFDLFLMVPYPTTGSPNCTTGGTITTSNLTVLNDLETFVYTPCTVSFANNNSSGWAGQILGATVDLTNHMTLQFRPITVPGAVVSGYEAELQFVREITT